MPATPLPTYYKDYSLYELTSAESLVLVSFRLWLLHHAQGADAGVPDWRSGLTAVGLSCAAAELFEPLLDTIVAGARQTVEVQPLRCRRISRQESLLLGCLAQLQHHQLEEAATTLAHWLSPTATRMASPLLWRFSMALSTVRLVLPLRYSSLPCSTATAVAPVYYQPSSDQLH